MKLGNGIIFGLLAGMLWGLDGVFISHLGSIGDFFVTTMLTACIHDGLASIWIFIVNFHNGKAKQYIACIRSKQSIDVFFCALLGGSIGMMLNITAIRLAGAGYACAMTSAYPVVGTVLGILFLKEKCNVYSLCGIALVALGAVFIGVSPVQGLQTLHLFMGLIAAIGAMLCWALEGIFSKSAMEDISSDVLIGVRELISCIVYIFILSFLINTKNISISGIFDSGKFAILVMASIMGAFSYLCWYRSMDISGASTGMALNATYALFAAIFDIPINGNNLSFSMFIGIFIILFGTVLTIYSDKNKSDENKFNKNKKGQICNE